MPTSASEAVSKHTHTHTRLAEAKASSAVKQQVWRHTSELQTPQSHSDTALGGGEVGCVCVSLKANNKREVIFKHTHTHTLCQPTPAPVWTAP